MKIIALWDRQKVAPRSKAVFALTADSRLLLIEPEIKYIGRDAQEKQLYQDTGQPHFSPAFNEDNRFDFEKADHFMISFGGKLIWKEK